jgi:hypothetical protein
LFVSAIIPPGYDEAPTTGDNAGRPRPSFNKLNEPFLWVNTTYEEHDPMLGVAPHHRRAARKVDTVGNDANRRTWQYGCDRRGFLIAQSVQALGAPEQMPVPDSPGDALLPPTSVHRPRL